MTPGYDVDALPFLLDSETGPGGNARARSSDFRVVEQPLYEINGEGPHLYFEVEKENISTDRAVRVLNEQLEVPPDREIGVAGRKDKNALTVQRMSLEHVEPADLQEFDHDRISIRPLGYHRNKLQPGHLAGNRFVIRLRNTRDDVPIDTVRERQRTLRERGVPNYFGPQRFGLRKDTALLGKLMVKDRLDEFIDQYFGRPSDREPPECRRAREYFETGDYEQAIDAWPRKYADKRRGLAAWIDTGEPGPVLSAISKNKRQLFVSAYQSQLFNELLAERMPGIDSIYVGDIAKKTDTGGLFEVEDPRTDQTRASAFEISPTGLLPGGDPWYATGDPGQSERQLLERHHLREEDFERVGYLRSDGERRPFRFELTVGEPETGEDDHGRYFELNFTIPSGCYASVALREITGTFGNPTEVDGEK